MATTSIPRRSPEALRAEAAALRIAHKPSMPVSQTNLCRADDLEHQARFLEGLDDYLANAWPELGMEWIGEKEEQEDNIGTEWSHADGSPRFLPQEDGLRVGTWG